MVDIIKSVKSNISSVFKVQNLIAELDLIQAFASYSKSIRPSCFPVFIDSELQSLVIFNGKNPLDHNSVPNSCSINSIERVNILTGINGSGKTYYMKMVGLNTLLAHLGS